MVLGGLWAALNHPIWFLAALVVFILLLIWLLPKIWRGVKKVFRFIAGLFGAKSEPDIPAESAGRPNLPGGTKPSVRDGGH